MSRTIDRIGQRYGRLVVIAKEPARVQPSGQKAAYWLCLCECGQKKVVSAANLVSGNTKSCGCLHIERLREAARTHGRSRSPEHISWKSMIQRCTNPRNNRYHVYGAAGITVAEEWMSFDQFFQDMGSKPSPQHTLDRIDPRQGYKPGNCRWATQREQQRNRSNNIKVELHGSTVTLPEAAEVTGIKYATLLRRYLKGDREERLFRPLDRVCAQ